MEHTEFPKCLLLCTIKSKATIKYITKQNCCEAYQKTKRHKGLNILSYYNYHTLFCVHVY